MLFPPVSDDPCFSISVRSGYCDLRKTSISEYMRIAWITNI